MTLSAGTRLGAYEILSRLGAGGMGEVYRARDAKLDRDVAVKVLPASVANDPDALARFEREAKAVAALSHQNILSIFDFGRHEGVAYVVTELLDGDTLRGKLDAGPVSQRLAVDYGLQIAKGLSAAHEHGIVHRDLKPENVFVMRDGHVKILDFGLAKRIEAAKPGEATEAPTIEGQTEPGKVMGTVGYMSPEQARGLPVDHRSDIFSLGSILYELFSGNRAFRKDTPGDTLAAIIRDEPEPLQSLSVQMPTALRWIVERCLAKDPQERYASTRDLARDLSHLRDHASEVSQEAVVPGIPPRRSGWVMPALAIGLGL
ncbi:MAG TPA: serine/threonine-protein kinase, partial [Thermoanaerobaculia bacterium]